MKRRFLRTFVALLAVLTLAFVAVGCENEEKGSTTPPTKYTVTYDVGEDATGTVPASAQYTEGATFKLPEASAFAREGYSFDKWNDGSADWASGADYTMPAHDVTFTATWIVYDEEENPSDPGGDNPNVPNPGDDEDPNNPPTPVAKYTITFDPNNGDDAWTESVNKGGKVSKPASDPVHTGGKTFRYWKDDATDGEYDFNSVVNANVDLTATYAWKVTFNAGTGATGSIEPMWVSVWNARGITLPSGAGLSNTGKIFAGWTDGTDNYEAGDTFVGTGNHVLTAVWNDIDITNTHTVTVFKSSREDQIAAISGTVPTIENKAAGETFTVPVDVFTYPHYHINKWWTYKFTVDNSGRGEWEQDTGYNPGDTVTMPNYNIQLKPVWGANDVTISFDANGGSGTMASVTHTYNSGMSLSISSKFQNKFTAPAGGTFQGWATTPTGSVLSDGTKCDDSIVSAQDTLTLYAVWQISAAPTVTINDLVGSWSGNSHTLDIIDDNMGEEYVSGCGVLDGQYFVQVFIEGSVVAITSMDYDIYYDGYLQGGSLVLDSFTFTSKSTLSASDRSDFVGNWSRTDTNQAWVIGDNAVGYGLSLLAGQSVIVGNRIVMWYEASNYYYVYVLEKNGNKLVGYYDANEVDPVATEFAAGNYIVLTVDGVPNQIVTSGSAPDTSKIPTPVAPEEGKVFDKWMIAGTETVFDPTAAMTADVSIVSTWTDDGDEDAFVGNCSISKPLGTYVITKIKLNDNNAEVTYLRNNKETKTQLELSIASGTKPDKYGANASYYEIYITGIGYIKLLVNPQGNKLSLYDEDDAALAGGEFTMSGSTELSWVGITDDDIIAFGTAGTNLYCEEAFVNGNTTFLGLQLINHASLGLRVKAIYLSGGQEKTPTSAITVNKDPSSENSNWLVFQSGKYNIVFGKKSDGNYYIVALSYDGDEPATDIALTRTTAPTV